MQKEFRGKKYRISGVVNPIESVAAGLKYSKWHATDSVNYWPLRDMAKNNLDKVVSDLFNSYSPSSPIFNADSKLLTMGSCFAMRIREWMEHNGRGSETIFIPEGLNNSFAVRQYIDWALTGNRSSDAYWYDKHETGISKWESPKEQKLIKKEFDNHAGLVITFGLAEVWRDKDTNGVFWRGVPDGVFDPNKHENVMSSVNDNVDNIKQIVSLVREHCGKKPIIFTLSPVPLAATFENQPCIASDCISKSTLRVAISEALKSINDSDVYYWPSFEYVKWISSHMPHVTFGGKKAKGAMQDSRHVDPKAVSTIISHFAKSFFAE